MSNGHGRSTEGFGMSREDSAKLIVKTCLENGVTNEKQIAYILATAQHETRNFSAPEEDFGRSQARKLHYHGGEDYYGRGYVHLTHIENYQKFDKLLGMHSELVKHPELAKNPEIAAKIMVIGMRDGLFTGKPLDRYINETKDDTYNARRVVNGVTPSAPWSLKAAKECEQHAQAWSSKVHGLVEGVKGHMQAAPQHRTPAHAGSHVSEGPVHAGNTPHHLGGHAAIEVQAALNNFGYKGENSKPLETRSGQFGPNTEHAVKEFQSAHGLKPDGIIGPKTLEVLKHAKDHPLINEVGHPSHGMYEQIKAQTDKLGGAKALGFHSDKEYTQALANMTWQARTSGLTQVDHVVETANKQNLVMIQGGLTDPAQQREVANKAHAAQQPVAQSTQQLQQDVQQLQQAQQNAQHHQQQVAQSR